MPVCVMGVWVCFCVHVHVRMRVCARSLSRVCLCVYFCSRMNEHKRSPTPSLPLSVSPPPLACCILLARSLARSLAFLLSISYVRALSRSRALSGAAVTVGYGEVADLCGGNSSQKSAAGTSFCNGHGAACKGVSMERYVKIVDICVRACVRACVHVCVRASERATERAGERAHHRSASAT